jgi:polar amino acid transport system substrate-binding protein
MTRRALRLSAVVLVAGLALAACGNSDEETTAPKADTGKELSLCSDIPYEPMEFEATDTKTPSGYTGFDIDLAQQIADGAGRTLKVKVTTFDGIFAAMDAGNCDAVVSSVTITDERKANMDFTDPYFDSDQSLLVLKDKAETYKTLADLGGKKIGVQSGTTGEEYTKKNTPAGATITALPGAADLFAAIDAGTIDAIVQDYPINAYRATKKDNVSLSEKIPTGEQYGIAVKKGNTEILEIFNSGLAAAKDDGSYAKIYEQYFGEQPPAS